MACNKPAKTYAEQLAIWRGRGLVVADEAFALHCLEHHNYYRLSAYRFPLSVAGQPDQFLPGTTFEALWGLYLFDRRLRLLVSAALKQFEISARAHWAYVLGHAHGPQAFENPAVFFDPRRHTSALTRLDEELTRSDEVFVDHYRTVHGMPRPPIWAACEVMSFGLLSRFYENIRRERDRKEIARTYGLFPNTLKSILEHAVYVRNLCAHHARLWNRRFTITMTLPLQPATLGASLHPAEPRRIYNTLTLLAHLLDVIDPRHAWAAEIVALVDRSPTTVTPAMGFPPDWRSRPLWSSRQAPASSSPKHP